MSPASVIIPRLVRAADGFVRFSHLRKMALSPSHYKTSCEEAHESSRAMRIGTIVHRMVLGPRLGHNVVRWHADRRGSNYLEFAAKHAGAEIVTDSEWEEAEPIAQAVLADPVAQEIMRDAEYEVPLRWDDGGMACCTEGIDILGKGYLADLKTTTSTEPARFQRHAFAMQYHVQLAWYSRGARLSSRRCEIDRQLLIGVEVDPPHAVTVLEMSTPLHDLGMKSVVLWLERLRMSEENDFWPGYAQAPVSWDLPDWMTRDEED